MPQIKSKKIVSNHTSYINNMFSSIAEKYDLLNNLMTFGMHNNWKQLAIDLALKENSDINTALDLCSGTGDLVIKLLKRKKNISITCVDNCIEMLNIAKSKFNKFQNINFLTANCEELPFESNSFDLITIGFGLRNIQSKTKCLAEIHRVLKPNGVFACIDLGHPQNFIWQKMFFTYFFNIVPKLGALFANNESAYTYLPNSINTWYKQEDLKNEILKSGFNKCYYKDLMGGTVAIHIAMKR